MLTLTCSPCFVLSGTPVNLIDGHWHSDAAVYDGIVDDRRTDPDVFDGHGIDRQGIVL